MKNNLVELTLKKGRKWEVWSGWNYVGKCTKKSDSIKLADKYSKSFSKDFKWIMREEPKFYAMGGNE